MRTPFGTIQTEGRPRTQALADHERRGLASLGEELVRVGRAMRTAQTVRDAVDVEVEIEKLSNRGEAGDRDQNWDVDAELNQSGSVPTDSEIIESFDARDWASAFLAVCRRNPGVATDEGAMIGWFANALMRGFDERARRHPEPAIDALRSAFIAGLDRCRQHHEAYGEWPSLPGRVEIADEAYPEESQEGMTLRAVAASEEEKAEDHRLRHEQLHENLDELIADFLAHNRDASPSEATLARLMKWSHDQTVAPTDGENARVLLEGGPLDGHIVPVSRLEPVGRTNRVIIDNGALEGCTYAYYDAAGNEDESPRRFVFREAGPEELAAEPARRTSAPATVSHASSDDTPAEGAEPG